MVYGIGANVEGTINQPIITKHNFLNPQRRMKEAKTTAAVIILSVEIMILCLMLNSCTTMNRIPVQYNKYGPVHWVKYKEVNGKFYDLRGHLLHPAKAFFVNK